MLLVVVLTCKPLKVNTYSWERCDPGKNEANIATFLKTLGHANNNVHPNDKDKDKDKHEEEVVRKGGRGETEAVAAAAAAGAGAAAGEGSRTVTGPLKSNPLSPDRPQVDNVEAYLVDNNGVDKDKVADAISIEMAEEWIADPLGGNSTGSIKGSLPMKSRSAMLEEYGPNSKANQALPVYSEINAAEEQERRGGDDLSTILTASLGVNINPGPGEFNPQNDDDNATLGGMSAMTAGSISLAADNASTAYADSIYGGGGSSSSKRRGVGGPSSNSNRSSKSSTMSVNPEAQQARSKARARFYADLEEAQRQADGEDDDGGGGGGDGAGDEEGAAR